MTRVQWLLPLLAVVLACLGSPTEPSTTPAVPTSWAAAVTNPFFPLTPGTTYTYSSTGSEGALTTTAEVMAAPRVINGVNAVEVHDVVRSGTDLVEDTFDWYAQDLEGNVWYLGEDTKEYENGVVTSTAGTWQWGMAGAQPGIIMWADPAMHIGDPYRQEYLAGQAEDWGRVLLVNQAVTVAFGTFTGCVTIEEWNSLTPQAPHDRKTYCPGIGPVLKTTPGTTDREELVSRTP